jgi:3-mercaptopyruvate sulfurtransferase SseA
MWTGTSVGGRRSWLRQLLAGAALVLALAGCVVWPAGSGPNAEPMPLAEAMDRRDRGEVVLVDVRSRLSYEAGHVPGAISIPFEQITARAGELRHLGRLPVLYCG